MSSDTNYSFENTLQNPLHILSQKKKQKQIPVKNFSIFYSNSTDVVLVMRYPVVRETQFYRVGECQLSVVISACSCSFILNALLNSIWSKLYDYSGVKFAALDRGQYCSGNAKNSLKVICYLPECFLKQTVGIIAGVNHFIIYARTSLKRKIILAYQNSPFEV